MGSKNADAFEKACEKHVFAEALAKAKARGELAEADFAKALHSVLLEKTTMFSPEILLNAGVRMHTLSCYMSLVRPPVALAPCLYSTLAAVSLTSILEAQVIPPRCGIHAAA